ncbi:MAG: protein kinase [Planctomycetota bacterium]|nr:protein kinase [Planctomycetota bacterium]
MLPQKSTAENLDILMKVADALAFAHSRGVIHRDLKPENVMLGDFGEVLVMDWGLALPAAGFRKTASITANHAMGGTPAYMAPEMATGPMERISFKSDIYLMGAILFEILTGKAPHTGKNTMACLQNAARNEIRPTDKTGELMDVAFKAMASDPARRYQTVTEFQDAIRQYQSHAESILLTSRAADDLTKAAGTSDYRDYSRAMFGYEEALALWDGNARAKTGLSDARERYARCALGKGDFDLGLSLLDQGDSTHETLRQELTAAQNERNARVRRLQTLRRLAIGMAAAMFVIVTGALFWINAARSKAVAAEKDAREQKDVAIDEKNKADIARKDEAAARETAEFAKKDAVKQRDIAISAEAEEKKQRQAAVQAQSEAEQSAKEAREARTEEEKARIAKEYEAYVAQIGLASSQIDENAFDSARAVLKDLKPDLGKSKADLRDWEWGRLSLLANRSWNTVNPATRLDTIAVSPKGTHFVTGGWNGIAQIWNAKTGVAKRPLRHTGRLVHGAAWSPDGRRIITVGSGKKDRIRVWNAESGVLEKTFDGHTEPVLCVAFFADPDSRRFVTGSADNSVRLWDLETGESSVIGKHNGWVWSLAISPDGTRIASAGQDGAVILWTLDKDLWNAHPTVAPAKFLEHTGPVYAVAFSPNGKWVASGGHDKNILVWDPRNVKPFDFKKIAAGEFVAPPEFTTLAAHQAPVRGLAFSSKTGELASAGQDNVLCLWNIETRELKETYRGHGEAVRACAFDPTGRFLFSASYDGTARVWNRDAYESDLRALADANLQGHSDAVLCVRFSGDGKRVITASRDRSAKSWNVETGNVLNSFEEGHEFLASNAVFSLDGKRLFTAAVDNTVLAWDTEKGLQLAKLDQTGRAAVLAISGDGSWLLTGSDDDSNDESTRTNSSRSVWNGQVWDVRELTPGHPVPRLKTLPGHKREITAVAFSPRQTRACTADSSGKVIVWNTSDWSVVHTFSKHVGKVTAAVFLDEETLLTASMDKTVARWNLVTGEEVNSLSLRHPDGVVSLAIDKERHVAITACNDRAFRLWDLNLATETSILARGSKSNNLSVDIRSGQALTADSGTREIRLWNLETGREISAGKESDGSSPFLKLTAEKSQLWTARFTPDGGAILSIGGDESRLWDSRTALPKLGFSPTGIVASAAFSHSGELVVTGSWDNSARIWNANTGTAIRKLAGVRDDDSGAASGDVDRSGHSGRVNSAVFSPDDTLVLTAGEDRVAILWNAETGTVLRKFRGHRGGVRSARFSADGKRILTASSDKTARVWEVDTGLELFELTDGHAYALTSAVFSPDGRYIATGSDDTTVCIWNAETGKLVPTAILKGHTAAVTSLAFLPTPSADQRKEKAYRLVTGSFDNTAKVWDPLAAKEILTLRGHTQEVTSLDVSADGRSIVTGSRDGSAILWRTADWVSTDDNQLGDKAGPAAVSSRN